MKQIYLSIIISIITANLNAQITLTSTANSPQIGDSYEYIIIPDYTFDVSQSGANQTWDFSSASGSTEIISFIDLSSSLEPSTFPLANVVAISNSNNGESYFSNSTSGQTIEGAFLPGEVRFIYTDKQEFLKFPITYNDVFNETFSGTIENIIAGQTFDRTGTIEISGVGYGDLILPYTTVNNVLKIKIVNNYSDTFMGVPGGSISETSELWYNAFTNSFLAITSETYSVDTGSLLSSQARYLDQSDLVLGTNDSQLVDNQISVYPNPANNYVFINNATNEVLKIDIHDIRGAFIKTLKIENGKTQVNISDLHSGIYLINYVKGSSYYTKKMIVE